MFRSERDLKEASRKLLDLVERHEKGEIGERQLLREWKIFMREAYEYLHYLEKQMKLN